MSCFNLNDLLKVSGLLPNLEVCGERVPLVELVAIIGDFGDSFCIVIACFLWNWQQCKVVFSSSLEGRSFIPFGT